MRLFTNHLKYALLSQQVFIFFIKNVNNLSFFPKSIVTLKDIVYLCTPKRM